MYYKIKVMQLTGFNIVENNIKQAKSKLSKHKSLGEKSNLSIIEVARLMDKLNNQRNISNKEFHFSLN